MTKKNFPALKLSAIAALGLLACTGVQAADRGAPPTRVAAVTDTYGDITVKDPYRWLEKQGDPKVHQWSVAQDKRTRNYFDKLPFRKPIFDNLMTQISATSSSYYDLHPAGDKLFAMYNQPPKQQPMIAVLGNAADPAQAKIVLDPNVLNSKGTTAIDWFVPSHDGSKVAVSMSDNGSEDGSVHIIDAVTGKQIDKTIPLVQYPTGGGSVAWKADGTGFWYTRYPGADQPADRQHFYEQIYFHKLGDDPAKDTYVLGKDFPKVAEIALDSHQNPNYVVASVANGDGGEFAHYVIGQDGSVKQVSRFEDKIVAATIGEDNAMYLVSRKDAPRGKLLKLKLESKLDALDLAQAKVIVAESDAVIQPGGEFGGSPVIVTKDALYVREIVGGPSRVAIYDHEGKARGTLPLPDVAAVDEVEALSDGSLLYSVKTYLNPPYYSRYDEKSGKAAATKLAQTSATSYGDTEVVREFATSKDGTKIPLNIVRRKGIKLDGSNPVLLNGYGGYSVNQTPRFLAPATRLWLDAGGVFVIANLRGGGEFGEEWHSQGALVNKQNVFDDFTAAAQYLIAQKYTTSEHMAAIGGSNGGLLMGAVFTQHPELFKAVVSQVGIYDMLRVELDPNGAFNTTEFGSVKNPDQLKALYAYSPYHHVQDGAKYPAIFMATGETDGRVNPMHSRKMIARLQAATAGKPVYLSINSHAGHGIGSSLSIKANQTADVYAFLFDQLGMKFPAK
ncbi:prolyl oligopeptidase family serine peptidase [Undibacterium sp. TJN25]|uniref:prolyl oligopeptidase family serine peptidase n=1 Tax=Undibacterium sp. TJN25 TaxID=3413056 RepID=UPI003BEFBE01